MHKTSFLWPVLIWPATAILLSLPTHQALGAASCQAVLSANKDLYRVPPPSKPTLLLTEPFNRKLYGVSLEELIALRPSQDLLTSYYQLQQLSALILDNQFLDRQVQIQIFKALAEKLNKDLFFSSEGEYLLASEVFERASIKSSEDLAFDQISRSALIEVAQALISGAIDSSLKQFSFLTDMQKDTLEESTFLDLVTKLILSQYPDYWKERLKYQAQLAQIDGELELSRFIESKIAFYFNKYLWPSRDKNVTKFIEYILMEDTILGLEMDSDLPTFVNFSTPQLDENFKILQAHGGLLRLLSLRHKSTDVEIGGIKRNALESLVQLFAPVEKAVLNILPPDAISHLDYDREMGLQALVHSGVSEKYAEILLDLYDFASTGFKFQQLSAHDLESRVKKELKLSISRWRQDLEQYQQTQRQQTKTAPGELEKKPHPWRPKISSPKQAASSPQLNPNKRKNQRHFADQGIEASTPATTSPTPILPNPSWEEATYKLTPVSLKLEKELQQLEAAHPGIVRRLEDEVFPDLLRNPFFNPILKSNVFRRDRIRRHRVHIAGIRLRIAYKVNKEGRTLEILSVGQRDRFYNRLER